MTFSLFLTLFFLVFLIIGAVDYCLGNKLGLGCGFEKGFQQAGTLILAMVGMISFAPLLAKWLQPVLEPFFTFFGADPSIFAGLLIANDMGGYSLAMDLANDVSAGQYSGLLVASIMGCLIVFTIPFAFSVVPKEKKPLLVKGLLIGIITSPVGLIVGGLFSGLSLKSWLLNSIPVFVLSVILILCMIFIQKIIVKIMIVFGKVLSVFLTVALVIAILDRQLDFIHIEGLASFDSGILTVAGILIILAGAYPLLNLIRKVLRKPLQKLSVKTSLSEEDILGLLTVPINTVPAFSAASAMSDRGLVLVSALAVSTGFVFGDHLAFTLSVAPEKAAMVILGKLAGGICAFLAAWILTRPKRQK